MGIKKLTTFGHISPVYQYTSVDTFSGIVVDNMTMAFLSRRTSTHFLFTMIDEHSRIHYVMTSSEGSN